MYYMQNQRADTTLHFAAASGHRSLVKELIEIYQLDPDAVNKVFISKGVRTYKLHGQGMITTIYYCIKIYFLSYLDSPTRL